ncbi:ABC transporter permease [Micromonospora costi]|uniref:ABC transporter permease n=1 Tax=Micromonospora costi TaxID=1530042 RepID=A0A3B0A392_9ACTN|nr:ABC transporter permease [Micromonospora costi]RKN55288.1 ABC transporter permease [Micromonospora costi]
MSGPTSVSTGRASPVTLSQPAALQSGTAAHQRRRHLPLGLFGLIGLLLVLELVPRIGLVSPAYLSPTSEIVKTLAGEVGRPSFWIAVWDTVRSWAIGLIIAVIAGTVVGLILGSVGFLRRLTSSLIEFLRPIPSVSLVPLAVLLYGNDIRSKLLLIVYAAFWQVLIQVMYGAHDVDPVAADTARSFRLGRLALLRHVTWPTVLPYFMTGVRLAASVALILAVTGELVIGAPGLGKEIAIAQSSAAIPLVYAYVVTTGLLGVLVNLGARAVERRVLSWHPSVRGEVAA